MLCLNAQEIFDSAGIEKIIDQVEAAFIRYENGDFVMPDRMHINLDGNTLLLMPCSAGDSLGTKLVSLFPDNPKKNLPVLFGTMVLNDGETGEPIAILNGSALTAYRTGAVGGAGVRHLAPRDVTRLGIVGAGIQGLYQARAACSQRDFSTVYVFDSQPEKIEPFIRKLSPFLTGVEIIRADSCEHLIGSSQVIITATTSQHPVLPENTELLQNKLVIGIGSYQPQMREFPAALFSLLELMFIDTDFARHESGDLITPLKEGWIAPKQVFTLGKLINGQVDFDREKESTRLFKSVGMALFDVVTAEFIYRQAKEKGLGREVEL